MSGGASHGSSGQGNVTPSNVHCWHPALHLSYKLASLQLCGGSTLKLASSTGIASIAFTHGGFGIMQAAFQVVCQGYR